MDSEFVAFVKGSNRKKDTYGLGLIVRRRGAMDNYFAYHMSMKSENGTSAREEYRAIALAANNVPYGSRLTIYTNNLTAVRVFSGEWKPKKHSDILEEFKCSCSGRQVSVEHADTEEYEIMRGMRDAEKECYKR